MMRFFGALTVAAILTSVNPASANEFQVVTTINPVHSLVSGVMKGVGKPYLMIKGAGSPHTYSMKPSDAKALNKANVVFWIGPAVEGFLKRPLSTLPKNVRAVSLMQADGIKLLPYRDSGPWEAHDHGDHKDHDDHGSHETHTGHDDHKHDDHKDEHAHEAGHDDHAEEHGRKEHHDDHKDEHAHKDHHDHDKEHAHRDHDDDHKDEHEHKNHHDHDKEHAHKHDHDHDEHAEMDAHIWLDPKNAAAMVSEIAHVLEKADPKNAAIYEKNEQEMVKKLQAIDKELKGRFANIEDRPFIVFHDAFQYLEKAYDLRAVGSVTVSPEKQPGARRISQIREKIKDLGAVCLFSEPQFEPKILNAIAGKSGAKINTLDPIGARIPSGPQMYFELMKQNADNLNTCLSKNS